MTVEARRKLEERKIEDSEGASAITSWSEEIENKISMVDDVDKLAAFLTEAEKRETEKARQEQLKFEKELIERKFKYRTTKSLKRKISKIPFSKRAKTPNKHKVVVLMLNCPSSLLQSSMERFWGQFTKAIDKTGIIAKTKFSYLKEFWISRCVKQLTGSHLPRKGTVK